MGRIRLQSAQNKITTSGTDGYGRMAKFLFPLILLIYPLRHILFGVEWWDTGYNYANFVFMDNVDPMWLFSTYLGNALGNLFTKLPFGDTMLGLNVYTSLVVSTLALMGYAFFTWKNRVPYWIAFLGELLALSLCWCPAALLYNYLTYLMLGAAAIFLYFALLKERWWMFAAAGAILGINLFVRFSNLAEISLIVGVWAFAVIKKRKLGKVLAQTMWCVLGYLAGIGLGLGYMAVRYGLDTYVTAIMRLLTMPSEADDYSIYSMIYGQVIFYKQNLLWLLYLVLVVVLGMILFAAIPPLCSRLAGSSRPGETRGAGRSVSRGILKVLYVSGIVLCFYYLYKKGMYNFDYTTTRSMFEWAVFLLIATLTAGVLTIFRKNASDEDKLQAGLSMLLILVTPLGSNNHLFSSINNMFLVAPFTIWLIYKFVKGLPADVKLGKGEKAPVLCTFPIKAMIIAAAAMLFVQAAACGAIYVFTESKGGKNLNTKLENNDILRGMYTSLDRAKVIDEISAFVKDNGLEGASVILYGQIPAMSYYLDMPFAITAWPDLRSYNYGVMEQDLNHLSAMIQDKGREIPVILLEVTYGAYLSGGREALEKLGVEDSEKDKIEQDKKFALLIEWMEKYPYKTVFENEKFVLLQAEY